MDHERHGDGNPPQNCIPVFADINPRTYNIDPECVRKLINSQTKAVLAVDIFGLSADMAALRAVCDEFGLFLLSDSAQAPGARIDSQYAGTLADIGGFSLNYHKHIHCGEGGVIVTNDERLATRCKLIRNHAESVVADLGFEDQPCMVGYNFRMTEIDAAIACEQLPKLEPAVMEKQRRRYLVCGFKWNAGDNIASDPSHLLTRLLYLWDSARL